MLDATANAQADHPNRAKMCAAVARWIEESSDNARAAELLDARAEQMDGFLNLLASDEPAPAQLEGLNAFDLAEARDALAAEAAKARLAGGWDGWTVLHAESENRARDTLMVLTIDGEQVSQVTLGEFLSANEMDFADRFAVAAHRGLTITGGGGAAPIWTLAPVDAAERAALVAKWEADCMDEAA